MATSQLFQAERSICKNCGQLIYKTQVADLKGTPNEFQWVHLYTATAYCQPYKTGPTAEPIEEA